MGVHIESHFIRYRYSIVNKPATVTQHTLNTNKPKLHHMQVEHFKTYEMTWFEDTSPTSELFFSCVLEMTEYKVGKLSKLLFQ